MARKTRLPGRTNSKLKRQRQFCGVTQHAMALCLGMSYNRYCEIGQGKDKEMKPIVSFKGTEKTLVLNKTNFNRIAHLTQQPDTDDWAGHQITLFVDVTEYQGKSVNCIRIQMAPPQSPVQVDYNPDPKAEAPSLDDIPF